MELSRLSSIMAMIGAVNIAYALFGLMQRNWVNTLIPMVTYLFLMYSSAILDNESMERAREKQIREFVGQDLNHEEKV